MYSGCRMILLGSPQGVDFSCRRPASKNTTHAVRPQKTLCGGIPGSFLEPLARSWSHFVGTYCQKLTNSVQN